MSATTTTVLVTGARGKTGREVAAQLAARERVAIRGGSSDPAQVDAAGVEPVAFDWGRPATWADALAGVDAVYLMRPDVEEAPERVAGVVAVAPPAARVVLLSEMGAQDEPPGTWVPEVERAVTDGERPWTILRPTWFQQVLTDDRFFRGAIAENGVLPMPTGAGAAVSWVDAGDIAAVAVEALTTPGHEGEAYTISGPAAVEAGEVASLLSTRTGRPVHAADPSPEDLVAGLDPWTADLVTALDARVRAGGFRAVTDTVSRVTGRPARSMEEFIAAHASAWQEPVAHGGDLA